MFKVQFSHDNKRWFDYGADAIKPGRLFENLEEAMQIFERLSNDVGSLLQHVRIINESGLEVSKCPP